MDDTYIGALRKAIGRGVTVVVLLLSVSPVIASSSDALLAERYQRAAVVAQVQISAVHRQVDNALSELGMVAIQGYVYSGVSHQVWKGEVSKTMAFRIGIEACEEKLSKGGRYLIFASPDSYGRLQVASCEEAVPEQEAAPLLSQLEQIQKQG